MQQEAAAAAVKVQQEAVAFELRARQAAAAATAAALAAAATHHNNNSSVADKAAIVNELNRNIKHMMSKEKSTSSRHGSTSPKKSNSSSKLSSSRSSSSRTYSSRGNSRTSSSNSTSKSSKDRRRDDKSEHRSGERRKVRTSSTTSSSTHPKSLTKKTSGEKITSTVVDKVVNVPIDDTTKCNANLLDREESPIPPEAPIISVHDVDLPEDGLFGIDHLREEDKVAAETISTEKSETITITVESILSVEEITPSSVEQTVDVESSTKTTTTTTIPVGNHQTDQSKDPVMIVIIDRFIYRVRHHQTIVFLLIKQSHHHTQPVILLLKSSNRNTHDSKVFFLKTCFVYIFFFILVKFLLFYLCGVDILLFSSYQLRLQCVILSIRNKW